MEKVITSLMGNLKKLNDELELEEKNIAKIQEKLADKQKAQIQLPAK
jgi:hypothetical protein